LVLIGDGQYRMKLERLSVDLRVSERVCFLGQLPAGQAIRGQLDQAHLFVLPSRTEGLPRAMIEAMARGLPCIGSAVGGIPELLQKEELVPAGDAMALAEKIKEVVGDPQRLAAMARRNLAVSRQYHEALLRKPRMRFYEYIRAKAAERMTCRRMPDS
ncbi:MAG: glycosyl transferase family 1, partial [Nitrospiraceae bacterium]